MRSGSSCPAIYKARAGAGNRSRETDMAYRQRATGMSARALPPKTAQINAGTRTGCPIRSTATTCNYGNGHSPADPSHELGDGPGGKRQSAREEKFAQVVRLKGSGAVTGIRGLSSSPRQRKIPIRTHVRRPDGPPLLYFAAVLSCSICSNYASDQAELRRFELLTSCMPSGGRTSPRVYVRRSSSSLVPCPTTPVRVSCGTSVLYSAPEPHPFAGVAAPQSFPTTGRP